MDGQTSYPPFPWTVQATGLQFGEAIVVFEDNNETKTPSLLVYLESGETVTLPPYRYCTAPGDVLYCLEGGAGAEVPVRIDAIGLAAGEQPLWSNEPPQTPNSKGKYYGAFGYTDSYLYFNDTTNLWFAPRF